MQTISDSLEPTYPFWIAKDLWDVITAAGLLAELDPDNITFVQRTDGAWEYQAPPGKEQALGNIEVLQTWFTTSVSPFAWIDRAIKNRAGIPNKLWNAIKKKFLSNYEYDKEIASHYPAIAKKLQLNERKNAQQELKSKPKLINDTPPYLDENHPNFSLELKMAITAWIELYGDANAQPTSVEKLVVRVLKTHHLEASNSSVTKRIATLITPNTMKVKRGACLPFKSK